MQLYQPVKSLPEMNRIEACFLDNGMDSFTSIFVWIFRHNDHYRIGYGTFGHILTSFSSN